MFIFHFFLFGVDFFCLTLIFLFVFVFCLFSLCPVVCVVQEQPGQGESTNKQVSEIEVMSTSSGYAGTTAERTAYLREKLESESGASTGKVVDNEGEREEELVGDQGAEAMTEMLSAFDDNDD